MLLNNMVMGLPQTGTTWFGCKVIIPTTNTCFFYGIGGVVRKVEGIDHLSLPHPWKHVAYYIYKYITCEG